jgi:peptidoglycan-associated lipoprotein
MRHLGVTARALACAGLAAVASALLSACGTVAPAGSSGQPPESAVYVRHPHVSTVVATPPRDEDSMLSRRTIYFDFDDDGIRPADHVLLRSHANYMMTRLGARLRLEGHADERGGTEYNLALGQRRAESVRRFMVQAGVPDLVLEAVSLGEEMPVDPSHNESAWGLNRRVELRYLSR